jgi:HPt (histidine-containing phosphotransfer) domain-containing protein
VSPGLRDVLDASQVEDLRGVDGGVMLAKLVGMYLSRTPERIKQLRAHVAGQNFAEIAREAHTLKGASGSLGVARVADVCSSLETAAKAEDASQFGELMEALEGEYARASYALKALVATGKG